MMVMMEFGLNIYVAEWGYRGGIFRASSWHNKPSTTQELLWLMCLLACPELVEGWFTRFIWIDVSRLTKYVLREITECVVVDVLRQWLTYE